MTEALNHFIEYDEASHVYWIDGEEVPSITQTLTEVGMINTDYFTPEHARRGTLVHLMTESLDRGGNAGIALRDDDGYTPSEFDMAAGYAAQWLKLREAVRFKIRPDGIERKVFSPTHGYAGRLDRHIEIAAPCVDVALAELKTNKGGYIPKWTRFQLAAQGFALDPCEIFRRFAFVLTPTRFIVEEFPLEEYIQDRDDFLAMVRVARVKRRIG